MPVYHSHYKLDRINNKDYQYTKTAGHNQKLRLSRMGNIVQISSPICLVPDYLIAPKIELHTPSIQVNSDLFYIIENYWAVHQGKNPHFFQDGHYVSKNKHAKNLM